VTAGLDDYLLGLGTVLIGEPADAVEAGHGFRSGRDGAATDLLEARYSALLVIVEDRHAERVADELQTKGRVLRQRLAAPQRQAALRTFAARLKSSVLWLEETLRRELDKAAAAQESDEARIELTIAAGRAELSVERERLQRALTALRADLEEELRELQTKTSMVPDGGTTEMETRVDELERDIADCNRNTALSILDQMDWLAAHALDLQARAAKACPEAAIAIEAQLHEVEIRMRKNRAELTAALSASAEQVRQCVDHLRFDAAREKSCGCAGLHDDVRRLVQSHAVLKSDLHRLENEETRAWKNLGEGFRNSWQALRESLDQVSHRSQ
jgi:hypothetical protein